MDAKPLPAKFHRDLRKVLTSVGSVKANPEPPKPPPLLPENHVGGCARPKLVQEGGRFKLVLGEGLPCDSISTISYRNTLGSVISASHEWKHDGPLESDWYEGAIIESQWELLGPPSIKAMVWNFSRALAEASLEGFPKAADAVIEERLAICRKCDYWEEELRFGFGKCKHPGCGCTKAKLWLATEQCPQKFWLKVPE